MARKDLAKAQLNKEDEFYTQLEDIEKELKYYKKHFKNKIVFCNCDDPYESNFFKYFCLNFNSLKLKKLICTCYSGSPVLGDQLSLFDVDNVNPVEEKQAYKVELTEVTDYNKDGTIDLSDVEQLLKREKSVVTLLEGNGDFRSDECIELLKQSDIVVTNPPFSLFREYVAQLMKYKKKFLIIGGQNALTYKDIFEHLKNDEIWLGYKNGDMKFTVPPYYQERKSRFWIDENGQKWRSLGNICWFTNLDIEKRHESLPLFKTYNKEDYPKYDNYDAINVNKVAEIPCDYFGYMGVPITFMNSYNPEQFEILGIMNTGEQNEGIRYDNTPHGRPVVNGKELYLRYIIRRKQ